MFLKTNLHFHTADDPEDGKIINYSFKEGIDRAAELGFEIMALTCHNRFIDSGEYKKYAEQKNILLICGIEKTVEKRHIIILNADESAENLKTFGELENYKKNRPEIFIIAPHPYFRTGYCLKEKLLQNIHLFDAVENSWFYSKKINYNARAEKIAESRKLPFIATSDTHDLKFLNRSYALIDAEEKTETAVFEAIRKRKFRNITEPNKFWREMIWRATIKPDWLKFLFFLKERGRAVLSPLRCSSRG